MEDSGGRRLGASGAVLAHPLVVVCLLGWLVNDHVLKAQYHNVVTGKLSDVFAMVVFPLLIAVALTKITSRPLHWGVGITLVFFSSINLSAAADRVTERALSMFIPSELTQDPTDLLVLPFLAVAVWVWQNPFREWSEIRSRFGQVVLAAGLITCLGSSATTPTTNAIIGTIVLDEDTPTITMDVRFSLDGVAAEPDLGVDLGVIAFGEGTSPSDRAPSNLVTWENDEDTLTFTLTDTSWAPVEVTWAATGVGVAGDTCPWERLSCEPSQFPSLEIRVPPDEFGPEPDLRVEMADGDIVSTASYGTVVAEARLLLREPGVRLLLGPQTFAAATDLQRFQGPMNRTAEIAVPADCEYPCEISVWTSTVQPKPTRKGSEQFATPSFALYGDAELISSETHRLVGVARDELEVQVTKDMLTDGDDEIRLGFCLVLGEYEQEQTPAERLTTLSYLLVGTDENPFVSLTEFPPNQPANAGRPTLSNREALTTTAAEREAECLEYQEVVLYKDLLDPDETVYVEAGVLKLQGYQRPDIEIVRR